MVAVQGSVPVVVGELCDDLKQGLLSTRLGVSGVIDRVDAVVSVEQLGAQALVLGLELTNSLRLRHVAEVAGLDSPAGEDLGDSHWFSLVGVWLG